MKHTAKKTLAILLCLALMLGLMPGMSLTAYAAETYERFDFRNWAENYVPGKHFTADVNGYTHVYGDGLSLDSDCPDSEYIIIRAKDGTTINKLVLHAIYLSGIPAVSVNGNNLTYTEDSKGYNDKDYIFDNVNATEAKIYSAPSDDCYFYIAWADVYYTPTTVAVTGVTLKEGETALAEGATKTLTVGDALTLTATVTPDDATDKTVIWLSDDEDVATVNNGVVTAVGAGSTTIYAIAINGTDDGADDVEASVTVTVNAPAPTTYTVTWKNGDTVLKTDTVEEGNAPAYTGTTPEKAEDESYTYTFSGWSDGTNAYGATDPLPTVTGDITYTATFTATAKVTYTVTFSANGKTVNKEVTLPHTFWCDYDSENGELDIIIQALYDLSEGYCNRFSTPSSSGSESVTAGTQNNHYITVNAPFEGTATVEGQYYSYFFGDYFNYTLQITCQAVAPAPTYTVTWLNWDETELEKDEGVAEGATPSFDGVPPTLTGAYATYTFSGWSPEPANVTADASYTALFDETLNDGVYTSEVSYIYSNVEISNVDVFSEQLSEDDLVQVMTDLQNGKIVAVYGELAATNEPVAAVYDLAGYDYTFYDHNGNKLEGQAQKTTVPTTNFGYDSELSLNFTTLPVDPSEVYAVYVEATTAPAVPNFYSKDDVAALIGNKTAPTNNDPDTKDNDTLFLGWYKDEACTQPITSPADIPEGGAYAKFIPAKSLGLLVQFRNPAKSGQANKTDLRLIATVPDPALYQEIGFEVKTDRTGEMKLLIDKHYRDNIYSGFVTQTINGVTSRYTVENALNDHVGDAQWSKYITSLNLNNMPNSLYLERTTNFEVKQYIITKDGTRAEIGVKEFAITHDNNKEPTLAE